jgi:hypothetical protein
MADAPPTPLVALCPHCRKSYAVRPEQQGKTAKCRHCQQSFVIDAHPAGPPTAPPTAAGAAPGAALLCPICQSPVNSGVPMTACPVCRTRHHKDCWDYNKGCGLYGCTQAPETEKLQEIEIPASYWGQTEKRCPRCNQVIQAAAVRCRYCGTTFETARPQDVVEFSAKVTQKAAINTHRRIGVTLLILSIIPCCAPVVAVGGLIWYIIARRDIAAMPPLYATICRLAVGISIGVTCFIIVVALVHSAFH